MKSKKIGIRRYKYKTACTYYAFLEDLTKIFNFESSKYSTNKRSTKIRRHAIVLG